MDDTDRALLAQLRANGRAPVTALAKAVNLSRGAVQNRIDRMLERGDILGFTLRSNAGEADTGVRAIMGIAVEGENAAQVFKALKALPAVEAIHTTNGRWDIVVEIHTDGLGPFSDALDAIRRIKAISASETSLLLRTERL